MKKIIAVAAALSLAACGGEAEEVGEDVAVEDTAAEAVIPTTSAGTYTTTAEDGTEVAVVLNADGTYTVMQGEEQVEAGTWEDNIRGTCLTAEGGDGEDCWNIQPGEGGMMDVTDSTGETMSYSYEA